MLPHQHFLISGAAIAPFALQDPAVFTRFGKFMAVIADTGVLRLGMRTHFGMFTLFLAGAWLFFPHFFTAVTVGVVTHLLTDIPHLFRRQ